MGTSRRTRRKDKNCPGCGLIQDIGAFVTIYGVKNPRGKYCKNCFKDHQREHAMSLMDGRAFCLYCGTTIEKAYDWTPEGKSARTYLHLDHMDPISLGGDDSDMNTVYCCVACNHKKGNKLFTDWLAELKPEYREIARNIYTEKHHREPEVFRPINHEFTITIDCGDVLDDL